MPCGFSVKLIDSEKCDSLIKHIYAVYNLYNTLQDNGNPKKQRTASLLLIAEVHFKHKCVVSIKNLDCKFGMKQLNLLKTGLKPFISITSGLIGL